jgi:AraC-like DNA-binding protein
MEELQALSHGAGDINLADKYSDLLLTLLTDSFGITPGAGYESEINVRLHEMLYIVQNSLNCKWSLADMASEMKLTPITLQRMIKKRFNITAHQLLISFRMRQAEIMLRNSEYPLKVIAEQVGYSDAFIFSSAFRRIHGISPGMYRRRLTDK